MSDTNKLFKFDLDRKLNSRLKFQPNFLTWLLYGTENRKDHSLPAIFVINSIFSNRNQIRLSSSKVYDKLITMTGKKTWGRVPVLVGEL